MSRMALSGRGGGVARFLGRRRSGDEVGVIDVHHPLHGVCARREHVDDADMSCGSCSGSGVLLDMALNLDALPLSTGVSPTQEDVLTLGASVAANVRQAAPGLAGDPDCVRRCCSGRSPSRDQRKLCRGRRMPLTITHRAA